MASKRKASIGSQPMQTNVAYEMGKQCPIGQEIQLVLSLRAWWPDLQQSDAWNDLQRGLAERFEK